MSQALTSTAPFLGAPVASRTHADEPPRKMSKLLIVDDHALVRVGIVTSLGALDNPDLQLLEASTLGDAMELYRSQPDISLVLLDLNMPDCKGLQGLKQFLEAFPQARVAVISGTQDEFVIGQVRALGAVGYVTKGQAPRQMCDTVMGLLSTRLAPLQFGAGNGHASATSGHAPALIDDTQP